MALNVNITELDAEFMAEAQHWISKAWPILSIGSQDHGSHMEMNVKIMKKSHAKYHD
jgi:hypothetical protein